ncbi:MAG TPA: hypothetical protein VM925_29815 [Labilithrix sp.]|nr:hypothetical protein [Labilithrix sp.]
MKPATKLFSLASCLSLGGSVLAFAPDAMAACPEADPGAVPYVSAHAPAAACSKADLDLFKAETQKDGATFAGVEAAVKAQNAACGSCIFSTETDNEWAPFVYVGEEGGALTNYGACFEMAPGGSAACGSTIFKYDFCTQVRCPRGAGYCEDQTSTNTCLKTVSEDGASCGKYNYVAACPNLDTLETACKDMYAVVGVLCGGKSGSAMDASASSSGGGTTEDAGVDEKDASTGTPGSTKKKPSTSSSSSSGSTTSSGGSATPATTTTETSGCAQSSSGSGGSIMSALVVAAAVGAAASRRRQNAKR